MMNNTTDIVRELYENIMDSVEAEIQMITVVSRDELVERILPFVFAVAILTLFNQRDIKTKEAALTLTLLSDKISFEKKLKALWELDNSPMYDKLCHLVDYLTRLQDGGVSGGE